MSDQKQNPSSLSHCVSAPEAPESGTPGEPLTTTLSAPISKETWLMILRPRPLYKLGLLGLALAGSVMGLLSPYFQKIFIDSISGVTAASQGAAWTPQVSVLTLLILAFVCAALGHVLQAGANILGNIDAVKTQRELAEKLYEKTLTLHTTSLKGRSTGEIVAIYATDVPGATALIENALPWGANVIFPLLTAPLSIALIYDLPLHTILLVMGGTTLFNYLLSRRQSRFFSQFKKLAAERTSLVNTWVQNLRSLRVLGWMEYFEGLIFGKRQQETENRVHMVTNGQVMNTVASSITFILNMLGVLTLIQVRRGVVTPGELMGLLWILGVFLTRPFRTMPWLFTFALDGITSLRRLQSFFNLHNPHEKLAPSRAGPKADAYLNVHGLQLKTDRQGFLLHPLNLRVGRGEFVAIVGEVGAGKSLLLTSLLGENNAEFESYYIEGEDLLQRPRRAWKAHFSYVPQEGFIMNSSLRDNVAFSYDANESLDLAIEQSLRVSQFNLSFESGTTSLATEIGERGVNLSGGQRQRVNLARAHHYTRPIILMDDCLSAVDVDTERALVKDLLLDQWQDRTRILVTHRLNILPKVDRVFFMQDGQIAATGTYDDLLKGSADFRDFVASLEEQEADRQAQTDKPSSSEVSETPHV